MIALLLPLAAPPQSADTASPPAQVAPSPDNQAFTNSVNAAEVLITAQHFGEARAKLEALEKIRPHDSQVQFLLAMLDRQDKDYESAIRRFHRILVDEPNALRIRLELGRTYYESGNYTDAERQFSFARAGNLPPNVLQNIDSFLYSIRSRKKFSFNFSIAIAPDSNLNAGPATDVVTLYGLPFQLSPGAKANAGVGLAVDGSVEWAPQIANQLKFRVGATAHRLQNTDTEFDDMTLGVYAGPRLDLQKWEFNLVGSAYRRWFGDQGYTKTVGGSADATYYINPRMALGIGANFNHVDYDQNPLESGDGEGVSVNYSVALTPSSFLRANGQIGWQGAVDQAYANHSWQAGLTYTRELKGGITVGLTPSYTRIGYDAPLVAFNAIRVDHQISGQITLLDRKLDFHGFTPRIAYTYIRNSSNIALYSFARSRFEIGVTSSF